MAGMSAKWFAEAEERRSFSGILLMSPLSFVSAEASVEGGAGEDGCGAVGGKLAVA